MASFSSPDSGSRHSLTVGSTSRPFVRAAAACTMPSSSPRARIADARVWDLVVPPSNVHVRLPARELFQIEHGQFRLASLSFDLQDLGRQLATVDTGRLLECVARIHQIGEYLAAESDPTRQRELIDRMGQQLDAARHVVRPYFRTHQ